MPVTCVVGGESPSEIFPRKSCLYVMVFSDILGVIEINKIVSHSLPKHNQDSQDQQKTDKKSMTFG
jgi:hypothetical protein